MHGCLSERDKRKVHRQDEQRIYQGFDLVFFCALILYWRGGLFGCPVLLWRRNAVDLDFVRIECSVITDSDNQLTALLYRELRNFSEYFKKTGCLSLHNDCHSCREFGECPYRIVFSQQLSANPEIVRLHQKPPLPFALYINEIDSEKTTDDVTVGLVVIGTAVNQINIHFTRIPLIIRASDTTFHTALRFLIASLYFPATICCIILFILILSEYSWDHRCVYWAMALTFTSLILPFFSDHKWGAVPH
jgi:hypothetical protein